MRLRDPKPESESWWPKGVCWRFAWLPRRAWHCQTFGDPWVNAISGGWSETGEWIFWEWYIQQTNFLGEKYAKRA